ncbi:IS200/IS605 family transposase [Halolactibacillus alkaliphilus]|uniref:IS200/IS605 family transposase n=1 Tax=Halolactibacillus alkaliphilus TaxID=442899 RepID=UPI00166B22BE|nr:IS200/IS605 family transposase [Halolactibacillus alkaliphilus]GGN76209.1 IS200/IS605 family transposase [Halolactibacillus alkaliphilus]
MLIKTRTNVYDFNFHLVWVTKYRKSIFKTDCLREDMKNILYTLARDNDIVIQNVEVLPDHVHLMVSFHPKYAPSKIVQALKGGSARMWFKAHPETKATLWGGHLWSGSYFMSTLGHVSKHIVKDYIDNQLTEYNAGRPRR